MDFQRINAETIPGCEKCQSKEWSMKIGTKLKSKSVWMNRTMSTRFYMAMEKDMEEEGTRISISTRTCMRWSITVWTCKDGCTCEQFQHNGFPECANRYFESFSYFQAALA